jgi:hypothetical protein
MGPMRWEKVQVRILATVETLSMLFGKLKYDFTSG